MASRSKTSSEETVQPNLDWLVIAPSKTQGINRKQFLTIGDMVTCPSCSSRLWPGLDAVFCSVCRVWTQEPIAQKLKKNDSTNTKK